MSGHPAVERSHELASESHFLSLCRIGFLGRGLLYICIGVLVIGTGRTEDLTGALEYIGDGIGLVLLIVVTAGLAAYGLWRLSDGAFGIDSPGRDWKALRHRMASLGVGSIYIYLAYKGVRILLAGRSDAMTTQQQADTVLDLPGGQLVLAGAAVGLAIGGFVQLRKAMHCRFLRKLDRRGRAAVVKWLGRIGYAARGVIFLVVAFLVGRAAIDGRANEVGGMEKALDFMSGPVLYAVAIGLMLFGAFSIVEALFRMLHEPPVEQIKQKVEEKVGA